MSVLWKANDLIMFMLCSLLSLWNWEIYAHTGKSQSVYSSQICLSAWLAIQVRALSTSAPHMPDGAWTYRRHSFMLSWGALSLPSRADCAERHPGFFLVLSWKGVIPPSLGRLTFLFRNTVDSKCGTQQRLPVLFFPIQPSEGSRATQQPGSPERFLLTTNWKSWALHVSPSL